MHNMASISYLTCLANKISKPVKSTRSSTQILIVVPKITLNIQGKRAFKMGATTLWNSIADEHLKKSENITTFKMRLKTYLFKEHYCSGIAHQYDIYSVLCIICILHIHSRPKRFECFFNNDKALYIFKLLLYLCEYMVYIYSLRVVSK